MVRPSRRDFLGGSALTLAALTGILHPTTDVRASDRPTELDPDIPAPFADAFRPVPADDTLSTTYATVIAERIDADTPDDLSHRAQSAAETLDIDADELTATVTATPANHGIRLITVTGDFDQLDRGETLAVGADDDDDESNDDTAAEAETTDELPADWRLADDGETAFVTGDGVTVAAISSGASVSPQSRSSSPDEERSDRRIETARTAGRAAATEADRFAESTLGAAALPRLGDFDTVLLVPRQSRR